MGSVEKHGKGLLNEGAFSHKHLRWQMQCFALAVAMLCVGRCNALRLRLAKLAQKSSVIFWIREKGGNSPYTGHCSPQEIYAAPKCVLFPC